VFNPRLISSRLSYPWLLLNFEDALKSPLVVLRSLFALLKLNKLLLHGFNVFNGFVRRFS